MSLNLLKKLNKTGFTAEEARRLGVSRRMLGYYAQSGELRRLSHGVYAFPEALGVDLISLIREKLTAVPQAIVGFKTALRLHDLTEESPAEIELIVPLSNKPKRKLADVKFYQVKDAIYKKGVTRVDGISVTGIERTIIDFLRTGASIAFVLGILDAAKAKRIPLELPKIKRLAKIFRVKGKVGRLMDALL
jgi:predicted transcriptional regulator of viral defense system